MNELDSLVILKCHQIVFHEKGVMPTELDEVLVFEYNNMVNLKMRISSLEEEKAQQGRQRKDAKARHIKLLQNKKLFLVG